MININDFVKELTKNGLTFSVGVPDSLFKNLCFSFEYSFKKNNHKPLNHLYIKDLPHANRNI